jgi:hypothetical protein
MSFRDFRIEMSADPGTFCCRNFFLSIIIKLRSEEISSNLNKIRIVCQEKISPLTPENQKNIRKLRRPDSRET